MVGSEDIALFAHLVRKSDAELDLERAALLVAEAEYPGLDIASHIARLDELGALARHKLTAANLLPGEAPPTAVLGALLEFMYVDLGFRGNVGDYYDPRNSFLNDVLDRRTGIPITLALVLMALGQRVGLRMAGVSFPGHFLVRVGGAEERGVFVDPFDGRVLSGSDLAALWEQVTGAPGPVEEAALAPACRRQIVARMLNNLRHIYEVRGDGPRLCAVLSRLSVVSPCAEIQQRLEVAQATPPAPRISIN